QSRLIITIYFMQSFFRKRHLFFKILYLTIAFILSMIGISLPPLSEILDNICLLDTTDDESSSESKGKSPDYGGDSEDKGKYPSDSTDSEGKFTGTSKDPTPSFRVGTIKASSSPSQSVNADL